MNDTVQWWLKFQLLFGIVLSFPFSLPSNILFMERASSFPFLSALPFLLISLSISRIEKKMKKKKNWERERKRRAMNESHNWTHFEGWIDNGFHANCERQRHWQTVSKRNTRMTSATAHNFVFALPLSLPLTTLRTNKIYLVLYTRTFEPVSTGTDQPSLFLPRKKEKQKKKLSPIRELAITTKQTEPVLVYSPTWSGKPTGKRKEKQEQKLHTFRKDKRTAHTLLEYRIHQSLPASNLPTYLFFSHTHFGVLGLFLSSNYLSFLSSLILSVRQKKTTQNKLLKLETHCAILLVALPVRYCFSLSLSLSLSLSPEPLFSLLFRHKCSTFSALFPPSSSSLFLTINTNSPSTVPIKQNNNNKRNLILSLSKFLISFRLFWI